MTYELFQNISRSCVKSDNKVTGDFLINVIEYILPSNQLFVS